MQQKERVLVAMTGKALAARAARRVVTAGGEAIVVSTVAEARTMGGAFDRGIFAFDLVDGSGVVLAAELFTEARIGGIEFVHPSEERAADERPSGVRSTRGARPPYGEVLPGNRVAR